MTPPDDPDPTASPPPPASPPPTAGPSPERPHPGEHVGPSLPALLAGELGRTETLQVADHLHTCQECQGALVGIAVGAGALRAAARIEHWLAEPAAAPPSSAPAALTARTGQAGIPRHDGEDIAFLPVLREIRRPRARLRAATAAVAAAVLLVGGILVGRQLQSPRPSSGPVVATAALQRLAAPAPAGGEVTVVAKGKDRILIVRTANLPPPPTGDFYEVWLLAPQTDKMLPMGVLSPTGTGSYGIAGSIMQQFSAVDVSLQRNDGNPAHSKTSVLRAYY